MLNRIVHSPLSGAAIALVSALWQALTTGGIGEWIGLPFAVFILAIGQSIWALFTENRRFKDLLKPKLEIVFLEPDYAKDPYDEVNFRPFLQTLRFGISEGDGSPMVPAEERRYRIGIVNHSGGIVRGVEVSLTACQPGGDSVFPNTRLLVHDTNPLSGQTDVRPSIEGKPSAFFDVVYELARHDRTPADFRFCYSDPKIHGPVKAGEYEITLTATAEGCPTVDRVFKVRKPLVDYGSGYGWVRMEPM